MSSAMVPCLNRKAGNPHQQRQIKSAPLKLLDPRELCMPPDRLFASLQLLWQPSHPQGDSASSGDVDRALKGLARGLGHIACTHCWHQSLAEQQWALRWRGVRRRSSTELA